jgi:F0F1-type ATP synthase membrane subunit b/b'
MIDEAMKAVAKAEEKASEIIMAARTEADAIRKSSDAECEQIERDAETASKDDSVSRMKQTEESRASAVEKAKADAEKKAEALRASVSEKETAAIAAVIGKLI